MAEAFGPFLKTMRENDAANDAAPPPAASSVGTAADQTITHTSVILAALARLGPTSLNELQTVTALPFAEFTDAVKALLTVDVIELAGPSGQEVASLKPPVVAAVGD